MRIRIAHETAHSYDPPASGVIQTLRLTPRSFDGQHVVHWRIDVDQDCRLDSHVDAFGNMVHAFSATGVIEKLTVRVDGVIETGDRAGVVRGTIERFPPALFLRETGLTHADTAIRAHVSMLRAGADGVLDLLHRLKSDICEQMTLDPGATDVTTTAAEAFAARHGACQDFAHVFIACARAAGVPARYASGYFLREDSVADQEAGHAWAEAYVEGLGWVGFDPANDCCPSERHVRVAVGLDYLSAAPARGTRYGGSNETLTIKVRVDQAGKQMQA